MASLCNFSVLQFILFAVFVGHLTRIEFHTGVSVFGVMDKDTRNKGLIKLAYDEKQEQLEPQHVDVAGLTEYVYLNYWLLIFISVIDVLQYNRLIEYCS